MRSEIGWGWSCNFTTCKGRSGAIGWSTSVNLIGCIARAVVALVVLGRYLVLADGAVCGRDGTVAGKCLRIDRATACCGVWIVERNITEGKLRVECDGAGEGDSIRI